MINSNGRPFGERDRDAHPVVGMPVHYTDGLGNGPFAAIITSVDEKWIVELRVFPPSRFPTLGKLFALGVPFSLYPAGTKESAGCWSWPIRVIT